MKKIDLKYKIRLFKKDNRFSLKIFPTLPKGMATKLFDKALKQAGKKLHIPDNVIQENMPDIFEIPDDYYPKFTKRFGVKWKPQIEKNIKAKLRNFQIVTFQILKITYYRQNNDYYITIDAVGDFTY